MSYEVLEKEIRSLPEEYVDEIGEFIVYLKLRSKFADFEKQERLKHFDAVCAAAQAWAQEEGITEQDVYDTIKEMRRESRS